MCHDRWAARRDEAVATRWLLDLKPRGAAEKADAPRRTPRERIADQLVRVAPTDRLVADR